MKTLISAPLFFMLLLTPLFAQPNEGYRVFDLDSNNVAALEAAFRISEKGVAVGLALPFGADYSMPAFWDASGTTFLPLLTGHEGGVAKDVSEQGIIVGESDDVEDLGHIIKIYPHAAVWINGQPVELSTMVTGGDQLELFEAIRINEKGQIMGWGRDAGLLAGRGFLFENGIITDLGALKPGGSTDPFDMNEQGCVVGRSQAPNNFNHAFVWQDGVMTDLHDPGVVLGRNSTARAVNEHGLIVGSADFTPDLIDHETATVWDHGVITNLGVLAGQQSYARDVNDHNTIVGTSTVSGGGVHAFIYRDGKMTDLNDLIPPNTGWILANAHAIANDGRIVGEGFQGGALRAYLLVPDCKGGFEIYGTGCPGTGGFTPGLFGQGCPTDLGKVSLVLVNGVGGTPGLLLFGTGTGILPFKPGCDLQIAPLLPLTVPVQLDGNGAGAGTWHVEAKLPSGIAPGLITLQAILVDTGGSAGFTVTNPLMMEIE